MRAETIENTGRTRTTLAGVMELVDVADSKSAGLIPRVGSTPTTGTIWKCSVSQFWEAELFHALYRSSFMDLSSFRHTGRSRAGWKGKLS